MAPATSHVTRSPSLRPAAVSTRRHCGATKSGACSNPRAPDAVDSIPRPISSSVLRIRRLVDDLGINLAGAAAVLHFAQQVIALQREMHALREQLDS